MAGRFYGKEKWNPVRIITQILVMQVRARRRRQGWRCWSCGLSPVAFRRAARSCRQSNSLALAAGKRVGGSIEGQIRQTHVFKKTNPFEYFF